MKNNLVLCHVKLVSFILPALIIGSFILVGFITPNNVHKKQSAQKKKIKNNLCLGAYYFDGWSDTSQGYITQSLKDSFTNRKPVWGWITSTPKIIEDQINVASNAGIAFFNFCWYFPKGAEKSFNYHPLNHALNLFLKAPNRNKMKFSILVTNHQGSEIGPENWNTVSKAWIKLFSQNNYLTINNSVYLSFFSINSLMERFGSEKAIHDSLNNLKVHVKKNTSKNLIIGACIAPDYKSAQVAKACGFDIITGYNYNNAGFNNYNKLIPVNDLNKESYIIWNRYKMFPFIYLPVITLNWDPRPWASRDPQLVNSPRYVGYSAASIKEMIKNLQVWMSENPENTQQSGKIAMLYAWNEYGEGAWLTPSLNDSSLINGLKRALNN